MAAGPWVVPELTHLNLFNATGLLAASGANYRLALVSSAWTPNNATDELWAVASGSELANGDGYTTGGATPANVVVAQSGAVVTLDFDAVVWTASGAGIPAWRRAVLYYLGTLNSKVNPLIAHCLGDSTPADIPLTTSGNTITITPHANGVIRSTLS